MSRFGADLPGIDFCLLHAPTPTLTNTGFCEWNAPSPPPSQALPLSLSLSPCAIVRTKPRSPRRSFSNLTTACSTPCRAHIERHMPKSLIQALKPFASNRCDSFVFFSIVFVDWWLRTQDRDLASHSKQSPCRFIKLCLSVPLSLP